MMKKTVMGFLAALLLIGMPVHAQNTTQKENFGKKVSKFWKKTKTTMVNAGHELGDAIGFDDRVDKDADLKEIDGVKYMPIYTTDLFAKGNPSDDKTLIDLSTAAFKKKYPNATIVSAVVPQVEWLNTAVKEGGKITGYRKRAYCYVLAKDGTDGYINARFFFMSYRKAGEKYIESSSWPKWERTDIVPVSAYEKLK
ncbi:hypothetical protein HMPREF3034_00413 [Prevotella sp. DNF00663]|uniref:Tat pathway signal sequence n=1 Tax=Prevotella sp. DNF00663 TaxID=1384078 RepID=UPI000793757B|nr:Tat pathway signal sequence [Prevotella sp. DNF00663]KXB85232.1 hypothetical protein HMPREF3034_00413 [Prevotella sp. DNF00663]